MLAHKAGLDIEAHPRASFRALATLPFDPTYKLMATFNRRADARRHASVVRCYVKGAAPAVLERAATALSGGSSVPWDDDLQTAGRRPRDPDGEARACG